MENFEGITRELVASGGLFQLREGEDAGKVMTDLLRDGERRARMEAAGRAVLSRHDGAAARAADWVLDGIR
jgi:3-deoxy-D-manno-octulosonic-acid transferase